MHPLVFKKGGKTVRINDLRQKEMICTTNGVKLGYVEDVEFDAQKYQITALIGQQKSGKFWLFSHREEVRVPVEQIEVIGEDIILVSHYQAENKPKKPRNRFWDVLFE